MGLRINTNISSIGALRALRKTNEATVLSVKRLASGERITSAGDDAAGLAISEKLRAESKSLGQAERNTQTGISGMQVAEGGLNEISNILIRLKELSVQAASDGVGENERSFIDIEYQQMKDEINRLAQSTTFNGRRLINGEGGVFDIQVGPDSSESSKVTFSFEEINASTDELGVADTSVNEKEGAQEAIESLENSLVMLSTYRANIGALQNRLHSTVNSLEASTEAVISANSRIRDTDVAVETAELTKNMILQNTGLSVLAQANQSAASALKLI